MTVRPVLIWPHPMLATMCAPVDEVTGDVRTLADDMLDTMYDAPGRGLAAPQVGVALRLFVMDLTWKEGARAPIVCVNPEIIAQGDALASADEGCLSIPGLNVTVDRPDRVRMVWRDLGGQTHDHWLDGFAAVCAQHELDHLNGIVTFDRLDGAARAEAEAAYRGDT